MGNDSILELFRYFGIYIVTPIAVITILEYSSIISTGKMLKKEHSIPISFVISLLLIFTYKIFT